MHITEPVLRHTTLSVEQQAGEWLLGVPVSGRLAAQVLALQWRHLTVLPGRFFVERGASSRSLRHARVLELLLLALSLGEC